MSVDIHTGTARRRGWSLCFGNGAGARCCNVLGVMLGVQANYGYSSHIMAKNVPTQYLFYECLQMLRGRYRA